MDGERSAVRIRVAGRVQNVGFRAWTRDKADALGLSGSVANEPDGTVSVLLVGTDAAIERMIDALWQGPAAAAVTDVNVKPAPAGSQDMPNGFTIAV
jgi:acylphosphatase